MALPLSKLFSRSRRVDAEENAAERDLLLRVFASNTYCCLVVVGSDQQEVHRVCEHAGPREGKSIVSSVIAKLPPGLENRVGNVEVFLDDPEISMLDSRLAKLTHFEGRALAEYGKQHLGGKPSSFASIIFGETGAQEVEKRVIGYIPEYRLSSVLFSLGKLAKYATFCGPWSAQQLFANSETAPQALLSVHGQFSTLIIANRSAGSLAVRQLPIGTETFARAYSDELGVSVEQAQTALRVRPRLSTKGEWPPASNSPLAHTGTYAALSPPLNQLVSEITATADYFEYDRLAGKVAQLRLCVLGEPIAGFANWLGDLLHVEVETAAPDTLTQKSSPAILNFLEGMRSGLLKIGNQLYNFSSGKFVRAEISPGIANSNRAPGPDLVTKFRQLSTQPLSIEQFRVLKAPLAGIGALASIWFAANGLWLSPINDQVLSSANAYNSVLAQNRAAQTAKPAHSAQPQSWASDIIVLSAAMPYDMKLTRIGFAPAPAGMPSRLDIEGTLPEGSESLRLVSMFMSRLLKDKQLKQRFSDVQFAGAAKAESQQPGMPFMLRANLAGTAGP